MEYNNRLLLLLVKNLDPQERKYIVDFTKNMKKPIKEYISYLVKRAPDSDRSWQQKKGVKRATMYKLRKEAFNTIIDLLMKYYSEQDKIRDALAKVYLQTVLGIRNPLLKKAFENAYYLPPIEDYLLWGDKFPWHWAEYVFFSIYEGQSVSKPLSLFMTIGDAVTAELLYAYLLKETTRLNQRVGFPIIPKHRELYFKILDDVIKALNERQFNCSISLLKLLSYELFMLVLLREYHALTTISDDFVSSVIKFINKLLNNKETYKTVSILVSDLAFVTMPSVIALKPLLAQEMRDLLIETWIHISREGYGSLFIEELGLLIKSWLLSYGFIKESGEISINWKDIEYSDTVVSPPYMLTAFLETWLRENWEDLKGLLEHLGSASSNNFNRLIYYLVKGIVIIETNNMHEFRGHAMAFYQWARRNDFAVPLARLFRKILGSAASFDKPFFWLEVLRELKTIYATEPLLANIEFYVPLRIFMHFKHLQNLSKEDLLRRYWERYDTNIAKIPHVLLVSESDIRKHKTLFKQCLSKLLS